MSAAVIKLSTPFDDAFARHRGERAAVAVGPSKGPGKAPAAARDELDLEAAFADWADDWPDDEPTQVQRPRRGDMPRSR